MASNSKFSFVGLGFLLCSFVALMLLLFLVITQEHLHAASVTTGHGCCYGEMEKQNRKLLSEKEVGKATGVLAAAAASSIEKTIGKIGGSELRMAPSGPDPLHHNGNPKKPRTP